MLLKSVMIGWKATGVFFVKMPLLYRNRAVVEVKRFDNQGQSKAFFDHQNNVSICRRKIFPLK